MHIAAFSNWCWEVVVFKPIVDHGLDRSGEFSFCTDLLHYTLELGRTSDVVLQEKKYSF